MKNVRLLFLALFAMVAVVTSAQPYPVLTWRFANAQVIPGDSLQFDVELKCSLADTYHSSTQIYFNYNTEAFGTNIAGIGGVDRKIRYTKLELMQGDLAGLPKYSIVNDANNKPFRYAIIFESNFQNPSSLFMNAVGTDYKGFMQFAIKIQDMSKLAGIEFVDEDNGVQLMDGGQYYLDATHPSETKYGEPPDYKCLYDNDLLNFAFMQPGTITGTVSNIVFGPIAGATVTAGSFSATTAADGTYSMQVTEGTYDVTATANCFDPQTQSGIVVAAGATVTVDFSLTGSIYGVLQGTVTDATTMLPIENVVVTAGTFSANTAADGTYTIIDMDPDTYTVTFEHPDYFTGTYPGILVECNSTTILDASLSPTASSGTIDGTVTDAVTANPIQNATVTAGGYSAVTAADGTYSMTVPAGTYDVTASATCYVTQTQTGIIVPAGGSVTVDFALDPDGGTLTGYVLDEVTGNGIENATVSFDTYTTTTAADGSYMIDNIIAGTYDVMASHPDYHSVTVEGVVILCGQTTMQDFVLYPLVTPNPVLSWQFANIQLVNDSLQFDVELKGSFSGTYHSSTQIYFDYNTDAFGQCIKFNNKITFEKLELLSGLTTQGGLDKYTIVNYADNTSSRFAIIFEANFLIPNDDWMNKVTTQFQGFMRFKIKIDNPYTTAGIQFVAMTGPVPLMDAGQYYVDANHPFETLYGEPPNYAGNYLNDLMSYFLTETGTLTGFVKDSNTGLGIVGATVTAGPQGQWSTTTTTGGSYTLELPVGTWDVTASATCYNPLTLPATITSGGTTLLNFDLVPNPIGTVTGVVTDATTGNPIQGATVTIGTEMFTTGADGTYTIDIAQGTYNGSAAATGYITQNVTGITVVCGQTTTQDFALTPAQGTVAGTVTSSATGAGIQGATLTFTPGGNTVTTGANGSYTINLAPGTYDVNVVATNFTTANITGVVVSAGQTTTLNVALDPLAPPQNVQAEVENCNDVTVTWDEPGAGYTTIYQDNFESYTVGGFLALQSPEWTTWSNQPGGAEDPVISDAQSHSATKSVLITGTNDAVYEIPDYTSGHYHMSFWMYVNEGNNAYFNMLQDFAGTTSQWGMQVFFDVGGVGSIDGGAQAAATFTYSYNTWMQMEVDVDLDSDWAEFYIDGNLIHGWVWSTGTFGTGTLNQLGGMNMFAWSENGPCLYYFDDVHFTEILTESDALTGYKVYRDGAFLANTNSSTTTYTDENVAPGSHTYCVSAVYDEGESPQECADPVTTENCLPPSNLTTTYPGSGLSVPLEWDEPSVPGEWITWCNIADVGSNGIGLQNGGTFSCAHKYDPDDLTNYVGQSVTKIKFYWFNDAPEATFEVKVWSGTTGTTLMTSQAVSNAVLDDWTEVTLSDPVAITSGMTLWIGYSVTHNAGTHPAAGDAGPAIVGYGDMISTGSTWQSLFQLAGFDYNWGIQGFVTMAEGGNLQPIVVEETPSYNWVPLSLATDPNFVPKAPDAGKALEGYNVWRKNPGGSQFNVVGTTTQTEYTDNVPSIGAYQYYVTAVYTSGESQPSNTITVNVIIGINEVDAFMTQIYPNPATDLLNIKSDLTMSRIMMVDGQGHLVFDKDEVDNNFLRIETDRFPAGIYYIKIETEKGWMDYKVVIK
ncbi:MAG: carboxypeptidase regulatory-like domain-containing protein [Bacteroidales bacterium]|nr:carboxypeptidase regulatory-like domain-containing protein [Bacteroidales bacterium]